MDWPVTRAYCQAIAKALDLSLFFSWKVGGFEREMLRDGTATAPTAFEVWNPLGEAALVEYTGGKGPAGTRKKFPQVSADLKVRWCSAYLKIDVGACALRNQARFERSRTLFVTGERAEESPGRARYKTLEKHRSDARDGNLGRHIDQWRPVHAWTEQQVWDVIEKYRVNPHPAYQLGWGRVSCAACIFGSKDQFASLRAVNPAQFHEVSGHEAAFGLTIKRKVSLPVLADSGVPYVTITQELTALATSHTFDAPAILPEGEWKLPAGAFGESCGPT
jgi:3'-phosphoadenosine 5'-phosphosulfate sulfotransferase (PAPS reductase)/FAD synthetase